MMAYKFGDIITLDFPYSNHRTGKKRPALVIGQDAESDIVVARITSKQKFLPSDVGIRDWAHAGLNVPSYVRLSKLVTIEPADVLSKVGHLSEFDRSQIHAANIRFVSSNR